MLNLKKIFAILLIVTFLAAIPLTVLGTQSELIQVVLTIEVEDSYAKPLGTPGKGKTTVDYKIWFNRYKTDIPVDLHIYTANDDGLSAEFVTTAITAAANTWDAATSADLVGIVYTVTDGSGAVIYNNINALFFGDYSDSKVIAVAYVWVNRVTKELVECDILFNTDFTWGDATIDSSVMDLQNIATHELGHCFNLADIYDKTKTELTMYGYASEGQINKRDLEPGDIAGIQAIYGA